MTPAEAERWLRARASVRGDAPLVTLLAEYDRRGRVASEAARLLAQHIRDLTGLREEVQRLRRTPGSDTAEPPMADLIEMSSLGTPGARAARMSVPEERAAQLVKQANLLGQAVDVAAVALDESITEFVDARVTGEFDANPREAARVAVEALYLAGLLTCPGQPNGGTRYG